MAELEELRDQIEMMREELQDVQNVISRLRDNPTINSAIDGTFSQKWRSRFQGPEGTAYILRRAAGGNASFVLASSAVDANWSDS